MNNKKIKVLLAGTPVFSVQTFGQIIDNFEVVGLIAQPSRPSGRLKIVMDPATVMMAKTKRLKNIYQPEKISDIYNELKDLEFDVLITMAYGQIIPEKILNLAKIGSFNIHGSLLPKYRGASPIQYAIANGDEKTGITFMEMIAKMDAGDIIFQEEITINEDDTYDTIANKMSKLSSQKIVGWLNKIANGDFKKTPQDESQVTFSPKITKEEERIPFDTIEKTINKIRSLSSIPGAYLIYSPDRNSQYSMIENTRLKIYRVSRTHKPNAIEIKCKDGSIYAIDFQFEGRRRVSVD